MILYGIDALGDPQVSYCGFHNIITMGFLKEHYCPGVVTLGYLNESYVESLERENKTLSVEAHELRRIYHLVSDYSDEIKRLKNKIKRMRKK